MPFTRASRTSYTTAVLAPAVTKYMVAPGNDDLADLELDSDSEIKFHSTEDALVAVSYDIGKQITLSCPLCEAPIEALVTDKRSRRDGSSPTTEYHLIVKFTTKYCDCPTVTVAPIAFANE